MQHLNGKTICVIDCETTGLDPRHNEIWQICILPLNGALKVDKTKIPFYILMKPEHPEYIDWNVPVFKKNKTQIMEAMKRGHDQLAAISMLDEWVDKLGLSYNKYGNRHLIEPLGQNYCFDKGFIEQWLGVERYQEIFDYHYRDTMHAALYLNDRAGMHAEVVPYSKVNLQWLCKKLGVINNNSHDALSDCVSTAECYRKMCLLGMFR